ncbi:MAG: zinc ribbon domain-containing protein [Candidatus Helarchaeota archaeon]|nr:zinc ribbon domain-containing protein [Candidatus Helarchaeota archaeon]
MTTEFDPLSAETYKKLVILSELIIERNSLIEILGEIQRKRSTLSENVADILVHKFQSKISLIDRQISRSAAGMQCSICSEPLALNDEVIPCLWCGSPAHKDQFLHFVKREGHCAACGQTLRFHVKGGFKTVAHDALKTYVDGLSDKIHELKITFGDKPLEEVVAEDKLLCPICRQPISGNWKFCRACGTRLESKPPVSAQTNICPRCGKPMKSTWQYCKSCGFQRV